MSDLITQPLRIELASAKIEEMRENDHGWRWDVFAHYLNQDTLKLIQTYELKNHPEIERELKGKYLIKSALSIMKDESDVIDEDSWNII